MRQVREVLRLRTAGAGLNEITRRARVAPSTVRLLKTTGECQVELAIAGQGGQKYFDTDQCEQDNTELISISKQTAGFAAARWTMRRNLAKIQMVVDAIRPLIPATNVDERLLVLSVKLADRLIGANWLDEPQAREKALGDWAIQLYPTLEEVERASASRLNLESASHWFASALSSIFDDLKSPDFRGSNSG